MLRPPSVTSFVDPRPTKKARVAADPSAFDWLPGEVLGLLLRRCDYDAARALLYCLARDRLLVSRLVQGSNPALALSAEEQAEVECGQPSLTTALMIEDAIKFQLDFRRRMAPHDLCRIARGAVRLIGNQLRGGKMRWYRAREATMKNIWLLGQSLTAYFLNNCDMSLYDQREEFMDALAEDKNMGVPFVVFPNLPHYAPRYGSAGYTFQPSLYVMTHPHDEKVSPWFFRRHRFHTDQLRLEEMRAAKGIAILIYFGDRDPGFKHMPETAVHQMKFGPIVLSPKHMNGEILSFYCPLISRHGKTSSVYGAFETSVNVQRPGELVTVGMELIELDLDTIVEDFFNLRESTDMLDAIIDMGTEELVDQCTAADRDIVAYLMDKLKMEPPEITCVDPVDPAFILHRELHHYGLFAEGQTEEDIPQGTVPMDTLCDLRFLRFIRSRFAVKAPLPPTAVQRTYVSNEERRLLYALLGAPTKA